MADSGGGAGGKFVDGWVEAWCSAVNRSRVGEAASSLQLNDTPRLVLLECDGDRLPRDGKGKG